MTAPNVVYNTQSKHFPSQAFKFALRYFWVFMKEKLGYFNDRYLIVGFERAFYNLQI